MKLTTIRDDLFLPVSNDFPDFFFSLPCRSAGGEGVSEKMTFLTRRRVVAVLKNKLMRMIFTGERLFEGGVAGGGRRKRVTFTGQRFFEGGAACAPKEYFGQAGASGYFVKLYFISDSLVFVLFFFL